MKQSIKPCKWAVLTSLALTLFIAKGWALETLESSALRLELSTSPYSYRIIERATGETLLAQSGGTLFAENKYVVKSVSDITKTSGACEPRSIRMEPPAPHR